MDSGSVETLVEVAVQQELSQLKIPYLTFETIILRLVGRILKHTRVSPTSLMSAFGGSFGPDNTLHFSNWHEDIFELYESFIKQQMSQDERATVERILSRDHPQLTELSKFATCWYKYDRQSVCKWFAVDGLLGDHPKAYAGEAFSATFTKHNVAVRELYEYFDDPTVIKNIIYKAFSSVSGEDEETKESEDEPYDSTVEQCVDTYIEMVGEEEIKKVVSDRKSKMERQQQPNKRKRKNIVENNLPKKEKMFEPTSPPASPQ